MEDFFDLVLRDFRTKKIARVAKNHIVSILGSFALVIVLKFFYNFHNLDPAHDAQTISVLLSEINKTLNEGTISFRQGYFSPFLFLS